jgi:hypothetical protein
VCILTQLLTDQVVITRDISFSFNVYLLNKIEFPALPNKTYCTMGSQKVPGMVALHYNGRTYNTHLITLKVVLLRKHTLHHPFCYCWKYRWKAYFEIFGSFTVAFDLMSSMVEKCVPSRPIFRVTNSQKSLGECSGWVMTGTATQQAMCGSVRYRDAETTVPTAFCDASSELRRTTSVKLTLRNDQ